jgi:hypothetical protein
MEPTHKKPLRNAHICRCTRIINPEAISAIALDLELFSSSDL